jgi:hypothetical protein
VASERMKIPGTADFLPDPGTVATCKRHSPKVHHGSPPLRVGRTTSAPETSRDSRAPHQDEAGHLGKGGRDQGCFARVGRISGRESGLPRRLSPGASRSAPAGELRRRHRRSRYLLARSWRRREKDSRKKTSGRSRRREEIRPLWTRRSLGTCPETGLSGNYI